MIEVSAVYKDRTKGSLPNFDKFTKSIQKTQQQADKASASMGTLYDKVKSIAGKAVSIPVKVIDYATKPLRSIYNFATSLKGLLTSIAIGQTIQKAWTSGVTSPLSLADQYSSARIGFETLFKSAEKAQKMMNEIDQFAIETPFNTSNVISNIQKMMAYGWDANRLLSDMKTIGNAAAATGKGDQGLESIVYALSEIRSKGKLSTQELNQLASAGIKAKQYLAIGMGFGTDDAGMMQLAKAIESGAIGANQAIEYILEGMKEFDGMMDKTANETVSGLKSQLADMFEVNIARRWGQGLQDGAKRGLGSIAEYLDMNQEKLAAFGDTLYEIGVDVSNFVADRLQVAIKQLEEITSSKEFQEADLFGKVGILWDKIIAEPFNEWWNGEGGAAFKAKAAALGEAVGESIANGVMNVLGKVFNNLIPNLWNNAKKLFPGGESADSASWLSGAALLYGGSKLGLGKAAGWGMGKLFGTAGSTALGASVSTAGVASGAGFVTGAVALAGAVNDLAYATDQMNEKEKRDAYTKGATKAGMVAAGTALGAAIGSIIPGLGTLIGAGLGAGLGGVASLLFGGNIGQLISDWADGTKAIRDLGNNAETAVEKLNSAIKGVQDFDGLVDEYKNIRVVWDIINESDAKTEERITEINDLIADIDGQKAEIEIKLKDGSLTEQERNDLLLLWGLKDEKSLILNASIGNGVKESDRNMIAGLLQMYQEEKAALEAAGGDPLAIQRADLHIKTIGFVIDSADNNSLQEQIKQLEIEKVNLQSKIADPFATDAEIAQWKEALLTNEQKTIELKSKLKPIDPKEVSALLADLNRFKESNPEDAQALILAVEATIANIQGVDDFEAELQRLSALVAETSGGMITEWEAMFSPLDKVTAKLERIRELKQEEAEQAQVELRTTLANGRETHQDNAQKIADAQKEMDDLKAKNKLYGEAERAVAGWEAEYVTLTNEVNSGLITQEQYDSKLREMAKTAKGQYAQWQGQGLNGLSYEFGLLNPENMNHGAGLMWSNFLANGDVLNYLQKHVVQSGTGYEQARAQKAEYQGYYDQYANAEIALAKLDYNKYGKTFDGYLTALAKGEDGDYSSFWSMISDIKAIEEKNGMMSEEYKLNLANMAGKIMEQIPESVALAFKGGAFKENATTIEDYIYNAFVKAREKAGGSAPEEGSIEDSKAALADLGINFTDAAAEIEETAATIEEASAKAAEAANKVENTATQVDASASNVKTKADLVASSSSTAASSFGNLADAANGAAHMMRSIDWSSGFIPHANGTITNGPEFSLIGEDGPEAVIPLGAKRRGRGLSLWRKAGEMLGVKQYADGGVVGSKQYVDTDSQSASQPVTVEVGGVKIEVVVQGGDSASVIQAIRDNIHVVSDEIAGEISASLTKVYANMA